MPRLRVALAVGIMLSGASSLAAQVPDIAPDASAPEASSDESRSDDPSSDEEGIDTRLRALEAREAAREDALAAALARVAELEASAVVGAESFPEESRPEVEEERGPTLRPLASLVTRFEHREGYDALGASGPGCLPGDSDCVRYRARAGFETTPLRVGEGIRAAVRFLPQVAGYWALPAFALAPAPDGPSTSGGVFDPTLGLHEGVLTLRLGEAARVELGRFEMSYGEHLLIGNLDWHPNARAFDGGRVRVQPDEGGVWVDAFWTLITEGGLADFAGGDRSFYGVYAGLGPALGGDVELDAYALGLQTNDAPDPSGELREWSLVVTLGGRARGRVDQVDLRLEAGFQTGRRGDVRPADPALVLAGQVDGEVGLNLLGDRLRLSLEAAWASGDDPSSSPMEGWTQLFPTAHAFLGLSDVMGGRTNVATAVSSVEVKPLPELQITLDVHGFLRPRGPGDTFAGAEGDLHLIWKPGAGLRLRAMYALFVPNAGFWAPGGVADPVHFLEVEVAYLLQ